MSGYFDLIKPYIYFHYMYGLSYITLPRLKVILFYPTESKKVLFCIQDVKKIKIHKIIQHRILKPYNQCWEWFEINWFEIVISIWFVITFITVILILIWNLFLGDFDLILCIFEPKRLWRRSTLYFVHGGVIIPAYSLNRHQEQ